MKYNKGIAVFLMLFCSLALNAQRKSILLSRFPFKLLSGGVVIIKAQMNNQPDTLNFIFDTGSGGISLDTSTAIHLNLSPEKSDKKIRGIGGVKPASFLYNQTIHLPSLTIDSLDFHVNNYEVLSQSYGIKIDGIIGFSIINNYIIHLNYNDSTISFYTQGNFKYPKGGRVLKPNIKRLMYDKVVVEDERAVISDFLLDTGAGLCILFPEKFLKDSLLLKKKKKVFNGYADGVSGREKMQMTVIKKVNIAGYSFKKVPVYIFSDFYNISSYPVTKGIMGNDLLRRFNVTLNYKKNEVHIKRNDHFNDPFVYAYSGLDIVLINNQIIINDVMENSPASKAGLKPGDVLLAVDNIFSRNLQLLKDKLQAAGNATIIIQRNNEVFSKKLQIVDIR